MIDLRYLQHVITLARHRNFARAANELGISQPALTRSIQNLERLLGVQLFDRRPREVIPTAFGKVLLERGEPMLSASKRLESDLMQLQGLNLGCLEIGADPLAARMLLGPVTAKFSRKFPKIGVNLLVNEWSDVAEELTKGRIELFIGTRDSLKGQEGLEITELAEHKVLFFVRSGHPLQQTGSTDIEQLLNYPLALTHTSQQRLNQVLEERGMHTDYNQIFCNDFTVIKSIVRHSDSIGLAGWAMIENGVKNGELSLIDVKNCEIGAKFLLTYPAETTLSPAAQHFCAHLTGANAEVA